MVSSLVVAALSLFFSAQYAQATSCNATSLCPRSAPCCSEFGFCGKDEFCLGGCNPMASYKVDSCKPNPVCKDATYTFADNSRIINSTLFDGDASNYDFVIDKGNIFNTNSSGGELVMSLTKENGGTRLSSTRYLHYGSVSATLKTTKWAGVVTAFITMSDIKDEIDWEFPGAATSEAQSNVFWQGVIPTPSYGDVTKGLEDTHSIYHKYTLDWQPKTLTFLVDDKVVRTVKESDMNAGGISRYPNTPSRIQLSIWPAGIQGSAPGTVEWAGGMINWNDPDYKAQGNQFTAVVKSVSVKCGDKPPTGQNITSYVYGTNATVNTPTISFSNASTLLNGALVGVPVNARALALVTVLTFIGALMGAVV